MKNHERITNLLRQQSKKLNWENIEFPVIMRDIRKFEKNNKNIAINVFDYELVYLPEEGMNQKMIVPYDISENTHQ